MVNNITIKEYESPKGMINAIMVANARGCSAEFCTLGAGITRIVVPDRYGRMTDVVLGYDSPVSYLYDSPCAGKTPGRFANRISGASFRLSGKTFPLTRNDGENTLHGGPEGFHNQIWDYHLDKEGVVFTYRSADGEEGYPGNLTVTVTYHWRDDNTLEILYEAETDSPTVINLTNHAYFKLNDNDNDDILDHILQINSHRRVQSDSHDIPTGEILPVEGTPFDFLKPKKIGADITADFENLRIGKGYNHYFLIDRTDASLVQKAASLYCAETGIKLDVETSMPGVMLYTGNWLAGSPKGLNGRPFRDYEGVALECQFPPDAPNQPDFPDTTLLPGHPYRHIIRYKFSVEDWGV